MLKTVSNRRVLYNSCFGFEVSIDGGPEPIQVLLCFAHGGDNFESAFLVFRVLELFSKGHDKANWRLKILVECTNPFVEGQTRATGGANIASTSINFPSTDLW